MYRIKKKGFVALTLVISISSILLAVYAYQSIEIAHLFDQTRTKEYRIMNYYFAASCIDYAILNLSYDYFFSLNTPKEVSDLNCVIQSVDSLGNKRDIAVYGNYMNMKVYRKARVSVNDNQVVIDYIE